MEKADYDALVGMLFQLEALLDNCSKNDNAERIHEIMLMVDKLYKEQSKQ